MEAREGKKSELENSQGKKKGKSATWGAGKMRGGRGIKGHGGTSPLGKKKKKELSAERFPPICKEKKGGGEKRKWVQKRVRKN